MLTQVGKEIQVALITEWQRDIRPLGVARYRQIL